MRGRPRAQFRLMLFDRPAGPWRDCIEEAQLDAIVAGMANREEWSGAVYLTVPAWLQDRPRPQP
jgi:hypothetical protein